MWCTFQECEGLRNVADKKPCGCGVLSRNVLFCRLRFLTPHTPVKYTTPYRALFLSAMLLIPSHSWKVHHTHRAFYRLRFLTLHTPEKYKSTPHPQGSFCWLCSLTLILLQSSPHPQGSLSAMFLLTPHTLRKFTTSTRLFYVGYVS